MVRCETCDGQGFVARGPFGARHFDDCPTCHGLGGAYIEPVEPKLWRDPVGTHPPLPGGSTT